MPKPPLPPRLDAFLAKPNAAVIATVRPDGAPVTVATWYDWEDGRVLVNMDAGRRRLRAHARRSARLADRHGPRRTGARTSACRAASSRVEDDADLRDIDRLAIRYIGEPYPFRDRTARVSAWIEIERWHAWRPENI